MAYQTRNWTAVEGSNLIGSDYKLTVSGEVEVLKSNEEPHLVEAKPQGINPTELILDLDVRNGEQIGGHVVLWKAATFSKPISAGEYHDVVVRQAGGSSSKVKVEKVYS